MTARRAAIYARVSTGEQTPENQLLRLREVAARAGWTVAREYVETASGATSRRPGLDAMIADAQRRRFDVVMAWDVSRLGRSLRDLVDLFETLRTVGCDLFLEQQALDTSTPAGRALLQMSGVFAEFERAMIVERTRAGMARARASGKRIGRPPASDNLVQSIRALRARGVGMDRIARELKCGKSLSFRVCQAFDAEQKQEELEAT
ncbi:recombinase family protein [Sinirhodobacter huangdaonensis]|uniref:Recombinase family protein n=1 Tax=Paenirhodobacter huangdaonensis TaxID=2501515 RepID=A0A443LQX9_9RHOB|nr:recombinase family protein [Sinirhodobacter huangdaonensis]RWR51575.1 recombinase family protein [Sinirhodobacter huangdaonensis]